MLTVENLILCYGQAQTVLLPYGFLVVSVFGENRRGHHNYLGIIYFHLYQKPCSACGEKLFSLLCSQMYWGCDHESLSIKYGTPIGNVSEQLPDTYLDLRRKP